MFLAVFTWLETETSAPLHRGELRSVQSTLDVGQTHRWEEGVAERKDASSFS